MKFCLTPHWMQHSRSESQQTHRRAWPGFAAAGAQGDCTESASVSSCLPNQVHTAFIFPSQKPPRETRSTSELTEISSLDTWSKSKCFFWIRDSDQNMKHGSELQPVQVFGTCIYLLAGKRDRLTYCYNQKLPPACTPQRSEGTGLPHFT